MSGFVQPLRAVADRVGVELTVLSAIGVALLALAVAKYVTGSYGAATASGLGAAVAFAFAHLAAKTA